MKVTYDPAKRAKNLAKHGLELADAGEVFAGVYSNAPAARNYGDARRYIAAGYLRGRMVVIVWTPRGGERRIISMRYCHAKEERRWRERFG